MVIRKTGVLKRLLEILKDDEIESGVELLAVLVKSDAKLAIEVIAGFGMKRILDSLSKPSKCAISWLGLIKNLNTVEDGRQEFLKNDGVHLLYDLLSTSGNQSQKFNSLVTATVYSAAKKVSLPFVERLGLVILPFVSNPESKPHSYLDLKLLLTTCGKLERSSKDLVTDKLLRKMKEFCPEMYQGKELFEPVNTQSNNRTVNLAKMEPFVDPKSSLPPEPLTPKSITYSHEFIRRIFNPIHGTVVYDFNDPNLPSSDHLQFNSRFESGNLRLAIQISQFEYDLVLDDDVNTPTGRFTQWFYFSISGTRPAHYRFNIINMSKSASQFGNGMQVCVKSGGVWRRRGDDVTFTKNQYLKRNDGVTYSTLSFSLVFGDGEENFSVAYHYPYTYSQLQRDLARLEESPKFTSYCRRAVLCKSLGGIDCDLLTITNFEDTLTVPMSCRKYVYLSARVHPGESNSSYIIRGLIQFLLSADEVAVTLRQNLIFKIVPMLNPDGVILGNHRCGLAGKDLNRDWMNPKSPTILWTKLMYTHMINCGRKVLLACDIHGHSRKKNVFMYGCDGKSGKACLSFNIRPFPVYFLNFLQFLI